MGVYFQGYNSHLIRTILTFETTIGRFAWLTSR